MEFLKKNLDSNYYFKAKINDLFEEKLKNIIDYQIRYLKDRYNILNYGVSINYTFNKLEDGNYLLIKGKFFDWTKLLFLIVTTFLLFYLEIDLFLILMYFFFFFVISYYSNAVMSELIIKNLILEIEKKVNENYMEKFQNITGNDNNYYIKFEK